jgi:hypothetical protein
MPEAAEIIIFSPLVNKEEKRRNKYRRTKKSETRMKKNNKETRKKGKIQTI